MTATLTVNELSLTLRRSARRKPLQITIERDGERVLAAGRKNTAHRRSSKKALAKKPEASSSKPESYISMPVCPQWLGFRNLQGQSIS
ncbi:hypothetical protein D9M69_723990 [compost metagenome]